PALSREKKWEFTPVVEKGATVQGGDILGTVKETDLIEHKVMVPPRITSGRVEEIKKGSYGVWDIVAVIDEEGTRKEVSMAQRWPIREPRPVREKLMPTEPLITGQRVIDTFFPVARGGAACVPGPFGAGKTVILSQLAKWSNADVVVYIGCGERGNEMTDALHELEKLKDEKTGRPLLERTVIVANTSNMPVAAREASVYTGITIAEYFRDMGYTVALMADSTSRWAEALREISARLEEMPGEEGYPAYLGSRLAAFYERAGYVKCLGSGEREGALTVIGSVSPPGGDLSEPVTQNTLRTTKVFWGLEARLANARHFPSINWLTSYSLYLDDVAPFYAKELGDDFMEVRALAMRQLAEEARLEEIVRIVGFEALSEKDKLTWETARIIREEFLMQNAFDPVDTYTPLKKQAEMLRNIIGLYTKGLAMIEEGASISDVLKLRDRSGS
ncbi:MAG: V-type ATP synthase subunit A, partial [Deltaproteobacteria bacterium]|nr:V-type ATP synthase subunit A [Deltaproteobacteria bacterium]